MNNIILASECLKRIDLIEWKSEKTKNKALYMLKQLLAKHDYDKLEFFEFNTLSAKYFRKLYGSNYRDALKPLIENKILQCYPKFKIGNYLQEGVAKGYRFNPDLIDFELQVRQINYDNSLRVERYVPEEFDKKLNSQTTKYLRQLKLRGKITEVENYIDSFLYKKSLRDLIVVNHDIKEDVIEVNFYSKLKRQYIKRHVKTKNLLKEIYHDSSFYAIAERGKNLTNLIMYKRKYYLINSSVDDFIQRKLITIKRSYLQSLIDLEYNKLHIKRNDTNMRLDTNITSMKSDLLKLLYWEGESIKSIDLSNSQFRIFGYILKSLEQNVIHEHLNQTSSWNPLNKVIDDLVYNTESMNSQLDIYFCHFHVKQRLESLPPSLLPLFKTCFLVPDADFVNLSTDYQEFMMLINQGQLYEKIASIMEKELLKKYKRKDAKVLMFEIAFSKHNNNSNIEKRILKKYFPNIIKFIAEFKKSMIAKYKSDGLPRGDANHKGNASFAVLLQNIESVIFIDIILRDLVNLGIDALTKHDSVLCKESDLGRVEMRIRFFLDNIFGKGTYNMKRE